MATRSSIPARRIPWTEQSGGLQPTGLQRVRHNFVTSTYIHIYIHESESEVAQSCLTLLTPWTVAHQAPLSMAFSRREYWSGLPFPPPGDLPHRGIEPGSPALQADALTSEPAGKPICMQICKNSCISPHCVHVCESLQEPR